MVQVTTAVKDHCVDALVLGALGNGLANLGWRPHSCCRWPSNPFSREEAETRVHALHIVNDLRIDVGSAAEHVQTGSLGCAGDLYRERACDASDAER